MRRVHHPAALSWPAALALAVLTAAADPAAAQSQGSPLAESDEPLEINAEQGIEWQRDRQIYVARGDARAASGDLEVFAETLTAHYREDAGGGTEIYRIDAVGEVRIVAPEGTVYGDSGTYDLEKEVMVLIGDDLRMVSDTDTITARDSLEYWETRKVAVARGNAVATREDKRIRADILSGYFEPGPDGELSLQRIDALGNVEVSTPTEYASGDEGVYYVEREIATLTGNVKITREENQLNGAYAEVNMATGVSRLLAAPPGQRAEGTPQRVRGLILPRATSDPRRADEPEGEASTGGSE